MALTDSYKHIRNEVVSRIRKSKQEYFTKLQIQLQDEQTSNKNWWKASKCFYGSSNKGAVSPIKWRSNIVTDSAEKAEIFNSIFIDQAKPDFAVDPPPASIPESDFNITQPYFTASSVYKILKDLDVSKANGPDNVSNRLLKETAPSISYSLARLFNISLQRGEFPKLWKLAHVVPVHKKESTQDPLNYRPVSLLSCISKIFEKLVFNHVYQYLDHFHLLSPKQSGFRPGDSTVNQLCFITHRIYESLQNGKEVRAVFIDLSRAFDKVSHPHLLYKLKTFGIGGSLLKWLNSYLCERSQRVVINGQCSSVKQITAGVPQGSVLGPLLFLLYINDIADNLQSNVSLYADDTSVYEEVDDCDACAERLNGDLETINSWAKRWAVTINPTKTKSVTFSRKQSNTRHPPLILDGIVVQEVKTHKHLGLLLSENLNWSNHIDMLLVKASKKLNMLKGLKYKLDRRTLEILYLAHVRPILEYCDVIFDNCSILLSEKLESLQRDAARIVTGCKKGTSHNKLDLEVPWVSLETRRIHHRLSLYYKIVNNKTPQYLRSLLTKLNSEQHPYQTRQSQNFVPYTENCNYFSKSFFPAALKAWNNLPISVRSIPTLNSFKSNLSKTVVKKVPTFYYCGERRLSVIHTQLRVGFSNLNYHLHQRNLCENPACSCGHSVEDPDHYFLFCNQYRPIRVKMINAISEMLVGSGIKISLELLLKGHQQLSEEENTKVFREVQLFIYDSNRFS